MIRNGISITIAKTDDVKKFRMVSNSLKCVAKLPIEVGLASPTSPITCSKSFADMMMSLFFAANSIKYVRINFNTPSKIKTIITPIAKTQSVSMALFGITLSYTFIVNRGEAKTKRLTNKEANNTSL